MIEVDLVIPVLEETMDFKLDEKTKVGTLLLQIEALILQKKQMVSDGTLRHLYAMDAEILLNHEQTLSEQGIRSGEPLIFL